MKTVFILGGDGFIGWPTALKFSNNGYLTVIVDNLVRRLSGDINDRLKASNNIVFEHVDITDVNKLASLLDLYQPNHIIHLAEQRSAPESMRDRRYTVNNNIIGTHNLLDLTANTNTNIVHIGTMGVFGYDGDDNKFNPGSIYHMTKCMDSIMFDYYRKNWNKIITDLHQGIVWGWETNLTNRKNCTNRFDYDGIYGTVLNRFLFQAANKLPLSVYGNGLRERAFIHLQDSVEQLYNSAIKNINETKKLFTEILNIKQLAEIIANRYSCDINYLPNPRKELPENKLNIKSDYAGNIKLNSKYMDQIVDSLKNYPYLPEKINNSPRW